MKKWSFLAAVFIAITVFLPVQTMALTSDQRQIFDKGIYTFNVEDSASGTSCGTQLVGSDNATQVWNYFKDKGLGDVQVAGIMGNMEQESHFDPEIIQGGGDSQNPSDAGSGGWGLIQWTPGSKIVDELQAAGIDGQVYELATQLDLIWQILHNNPVVTASFDLAHFNSLTSVNDTTDYFEQQIEAAKDGGNLPQREQNAAEILSKYGGTAQAGTGSGCGGAVNCQSASGVAKILCAAKAYDPVSYSETGAAGHQGGAAWHTSCPTIDASCVLDCSGLVNLAVYDAFSTDLRENTFTEASDSQYWQHVDLNNVQPGDLVQPNTGHVEIVDHVQGQTIYTFGSHNPNLPQPDQVGPTSLPVSSNNVYLHYVGPQS